MSSNTCSDDEYIFKYWNNTSCSKESSKDEGNIVSTSQKYVVSIG